MKCFRYDFPTLRGTDIQNIFINSGASHVLICYIGGQNWTISQRIQLVTTFQYVIALSTTCMPQHAHITASHCVSPKSPSASALSPERVGAIVGLTTSVRRNAPSNNSRLNCSPLASGRFPSWYSKVPTRCRLLLEAHEVAAE